MTGTPIGASLMHHFMTIFTMNGFLKVYDVSRHEPKLIVPPKSGYDLFGNFGEIIMAKCNATGTHLAMTIATESLVPDGKLYVYDMEKDRLCSFDFLNKSNKPPTENEKKNPKEAEESALVRRLDAVSNSNIHLEIFGLNYSIKYEKCSKMLLFDQLKYCKNFSDCPFRSVGTMKIRALWRVKRAD